MLYHVCPPVRKIIHSLKLVDYLHVQADNPWYNYNLLSQIIKHIKYRTSDRERTFSTIIYTCKLIRTATEAGKSGYQLYVDRCYIFLYV